MKIDTTRFGQLEIEEDKIINFTRGILGFPKQKKYVLLPHKENSPFFWLQSIEDPDLAFIVINPGLIAPDYTFEIPDEMEKELQLNSQEQLDTLVIITVRRNKQDGSTKMTANLLGPIVINTEKKLACQLVLDPKKYPVQFSLN